MSTPSAGSRPASTKQNEALVLRPTPSCSGQVTSAGSVWGAGFGAGRAGFAVLRPRCVCAAAGRRHRDDDEEKFRGQRSTVACPSVYCSPRTGQSASTVPSRGRSGLRLLAEHRRRSARRRAAGVDRADDGVVRAGRQRVDQRRDIDRDDTARRRRLAQVARCHRAGRHRVDRAVERDDDKRSRSSHGRARR